MFDVEEMIQAADLELILGELGIETTRKRNARGFELYFSCINPRHDDTAGKMSMAEVGQWKGMFNCWSCKAQGNILHLIQRFVGVDFRGCLAWLENKTGVGELLGTEALSYNLRKDKLNYGVKDEPRDLTTFELPTDFVGCGCGRSYAVVAECFLANRNISAETQRRFGVGVVKHPQIGYAICLPIRFQGEIRSIFYAQPIDGGEKRYPAGSPQGEIIFNWEAAVQAGSYIMVESILDVLKLQSVGIPRPGVACFTNMISDTQLGHCADVPQGAVFPDRDSPRGWDLVTRMVSGLDKSLELILGPIGKDPGACTPAEILVSYGDREAYSDWEVRQFLSQYSAEHNKVTRLGKT